jgi:signal peptidase II
MQKGKKYLIFFLIIVLGVGLDQYTKHLANVNFGPTCNRDYPGFDYTSSEPCPFDQDALFTWTHIYNDGAFLSMGSEWPPLLRLLALTILPGLLLIGVMIYMLRSANVRILEAVTFALIAAGGLGNIIDRILAGKVVDFMFMNLDIFDQGWGWAKTGIFNVADLYIVIGVGLYIVAAGRAWLRARKEPAAGTPA